MPFNNLTILKYCSVKTKKLLGCEKNQVGLTRPFLNQFYTFKNDSRVLINLNLQCLMVAPQ